jgi:hypothetical protein
MDRAEFTDLCDDCASATAAYLREAEKTCILLTKCARQPLTFEERFALLSQEIIERNAFLIYQDAKRFLHSAALRGYEAISTG